MLQLFDVNALLVASCLMPDLTPNLTLTSYKNLKTLLPAYNLHILSYANTPLANFRV